MHPARPPRLVALLAVLLAALAGVARAGDARDPAVKCAFAKMRAALAAADAVNACFRDAIVSGGGIPDATCVDAAHARLAAAFQRIETRGACSVTGNVETGERLADRCAETLALALDPECLAEGAECGGSLTPCCAGLQCVGVLGQPSAFCR
jgi:hypothetical protein